MNLDEKISEIRQIIHDAKIILIGAGAGLSTSAGYTYSGERFKKYFADFEKKYGFHDMYSGGFYPLRLPANFGRFGAKIFIATVTTNRPAKFTKNF